MARLLKWADEKKIASLVAKVSQLRDALKDF